VEHAVAVRLMARMNPRFCGSCERSILSPEIELKRTGIALRRNQMIIRGMVVTCAYCRYR
jgi:hypothetical protein